MPLFDSHLARVAMQQLLEALRLYRIPEALRTKAQQTQRTGIHGRTDTYQYLVPTCRAAGRPPRCPKPVYRIVMASKPCLPYRWRHSAVASHHPMGCGDWQSRDISLRRPSYDVWSRSSPTSEKVFIRTAMTSGLQSRSIKQSCSPKPVKLQILRSHALSTIKRPAPRSRLKPPKLYPQLPQRPRQPIPNQNASG